MALTFDFIKNPETGKPELVLKANTGSNSEKILLDNILKRVYGKLHLMKEKTKIENGTAVQITIGFGKTPKQEVLSPLSTHQSETPEILKNKIHVDGE